MLREAGIVLEMSTGGIPPAAAMIAEQFLEQLHAFAAGHWQIPTPATSAPHGTGSTGSGGSGSGSGGGGGGATVASNHARNPGMFDTITSGVQQQQFGQHAVQVDVGTNKYATTMRPK